MGNVIYAIGNTHFDPVWEWTLDEATASIRSTFRSALDRMKEYPEFIYSFSCPPVFEWIKEVDPELFEEIRTAVSEGRWDPGEGWWLQSDCNSPSGESIARQGLYGQRYLRENFGVISESMFNSDSFGHSAMMPQMLLKSGIKYYCFSRPNEGEEHFDHNLFKWQSKDGSAVTAYKITNGWPTDTGACIDYFKQELSKNPGYDQMLVYGVTNHGGAPTKKAIEALSDARGMVKLSGISDYFKAQENKPIPTVCDELQVRNFGVFINAPEVKRMNRRTEIMLLNAEKASVIAMHHGKKYNAEKIRNGFKDLLFNQFHDIIGGASIKNAYFDARNLHGRAYYGAFEQTHISLQYVAKNIAAKGEFWNLVVFNLNSAVYRGNLEAEVQWVWEFPFYDGGISLRDDTGKIYKTQIIKELSTINSFRSRFTFDAEIPAFGYKTFEVIKNDDRPKTGIKKASSASNGNYEISLIDSETVIRGKQDGVEYRGLFEPYILDDPGDTWCFNLDHYNDAIEKPVFVSSEIIEDGEVMTVFKITSAYKSSVIERRFTLYAGSSCIDMRYKINWREPHKVLKLRVPDIGPEFTVGIPYGEITRKAEAREMPLSDHIKNNNFAVICDGIFSYNNIGNDMGLSVLRSPIYGDLRIGELRAADYEYISEGISEGSLRLIPGSVRIKDEAQNFLNRPIIIDEACHKGSLPGAFSYLESDSRSVRLEVVKKAEDSDGIIIRMYEYGGEEQNVKIKSPIIGTHTVDIMAYEIKTLLFEGEKMREVNILED